MKKARKQGAVALAARLMMTAVLFCCWHASTSVRADTGDALTVDMVFVLDNSGSMAKHDPDFITRRVVMDFIRSVDASFRIGMVVFDADARLVESLTPVAAPETTRRYRQALEAVNYGGQLTNTAAGVERALYELKANGRHDAQKVMLLLTDGIIDTGSAQKDAESERWLKEGLTLESRELDVHIFGVAFTENADFRLMQTLAVQTGGEYFRALTPDDIQRIFERCWKLFPDPRLSLKRRSRILFRFHRQRPLIQRRRLRMQPRMKRRRRPRRQKPVPRLIRPVPPSGRCWWPA